MKNGALLRLSSRNSPAGDLFSGDEGFMNDAVLVRRLAIKKLEPSPTNCARTEKEARVALDLESSAGSARGGRRCSGGNCLHQSRRASCQRSRIARCTDADVCRGHITRPNR